MQKQFQFPYLPECHDIGQEILNKKLPVVVYGLATYGKNTIWELQQRQIPISFIVDNAVCKQESQYQDIPVYGADALDGCQTPVIICSENFYEEMNAQLVEKKVPHILPYYFFYSGQTMDYDAYEKVARMANFALYRRKLSILPLEDRLLLPSLDVVITERCSLKCRDCCNLMQYFEAPKDCDIESTKKAIDKIMTSIDFVFELRVLGGEPFVNQNMYQIVDHLMTYENFGLLVVFTNGTIVPKGENLRCLKDPRVFVSISNYGSVSRNIAPLCQTLRAEEIFYAVAEFSLWTDCSKIQFQNRSVDTLKQVFENCCVFNLYSLKDSVLYQCPFAGNAASLQAIPSSENEGIAVLDPPYDRQTLRQAIRAMAERKYLRACNYCPGRPRGVADIPAAIQAKEPLPYKKYNE